MTFFYSFSFSFSFSNKKNFTFSFHIFFFFVIVVEAGKSLSCMLETLILLSKLEENNCRGFGNRWIANQFKLLFFFFTAEVLSRVADNNNILFYFIFSIWNQINFRFGSFWLMDIFCVPFVRLFFFFFFFVVRMRYFDGNKFMSIIYFGIDTHKKKNLFVTLCWTTMNCLTLRDLFSSIYVFFSSNLWLSDNKKLEHYSCQVPHISHPCFIFCWFFFIR